MPHFVYVDHLLGLERHQFTDSEANYAARNGLQWGGRADVGKITWNNALEHKPPLITDDDTMAQARAFLGESVSEWADLPDNEISALILQFAASSVDDWVACGCDPDEYRAQSEAGQIDGYCFLHCDDGRLCFDLSR